MIKLESYFLLKDFGGLLGMSLGLNYVSVTFYSKIRDCTS